MRSPKFIIALGLVALLAFPGWLLFYQSDPIHSFRLELNTSGSVYVQWQTNVANAHFDIQRSKDQKEWSTIQSLPPQLLTQFQFLDAGPLKGINYYRIKLINEKNEVFFSSVTEIELVNTTDCYLWPQPASNVLHVEVPFSYGTVEIIDASGRTSVKRSLTGYRSEIPITQLPNGVYFIRIKNENKVWLQKFIKQ